MGNTSLETAERQRGENVISTVLEQLIQALAVVGARAETGKAAVDTARIDAEVSNRAVFLRGKDTRSRQREGAIKQTATRSPNFHYEGASFP